MRGIPRDRHLPKLSRNLKRLLGLMLNDGPVTRIRKQWQTKSGQIITQPTIEAGYDRGLVRIACQIGKPLTVEFYEMGEMVALGLKARAVETQIAAEAAE